MINAKALQERISTEGLKLGYVARQCGLSRQGLHRKLTGETEFKASEISTLIHVLKLDAKETMHIFFAS